MPEIELKKLFRLAKTFFLIAEIAEKAVLYFLKILFSKRFRILVIGKKTEVCMNKILSL
jgi:hypothetical protein